MLNPGDRAPSFSLESDAGDTVTLESLRGSKVVVYFYPKDDTAGCTKQACAIRDAWSEIQATGAKLFGVSPDSVEKHRKFKAKYSLNFPLLADTEKAMCEAYGTWVEKSMYGRKYFGVERSTFLIGEDGAIEAVWRKVKPAQHLDLILEALAK